MDNALKAMVGIYVGIFLLAGLFALTIGGASPVTQSDLEEKVKTAEVESRAHQPLNVVQFEKEPHQANNQVKFQPAADGPVEATDSGRQPVNTVRFDADPHRPVNAVGYETD